LTSLVGPNIFLNIFLSSTESFWMILSLGTHVSQPKTAVGQITDQYNFNLDFLDTKLLLNRVLIIIIINLTANGLSPGGSGYNACT
jgi:hypothetical protein